jgi:arylsulfate sulfotransferase
MYSNCITESRTVSNYPSSDTDPDAPPMVAAVENSPVVEIDASGNLINQWGPVDMVDQLRIGYFSLRDGKVGLDWGHANAVFHNPADDSIIVSLRHQSAVIKFSRATGELIWILGDHSQWGDEYGQYLLTPVGLPFEWQYYQHAPMVTASGTLMLHDNGNFRTIPFDGKFPMVGIQSYSRAVEYEIDEQRMEVHQVWEYGASASPRLYASFIGDADSLPITRNTLINFGGVTFIDGVDVADLNLGSHVVRVIEVNHETPADKVFEVMLHDLAGGRVIAYRSEKLTGLYPNDFTVNLVE